MRLITLISVAFPCLALSVGAQIASNVTVRPLSLEESVRLALEHNLTIRIARHDPRIVRYGLDASYGYYDPSFTTRYLYNDSTFKTVTELGTNVFLLAPGKDRSDNLTTSIVGTGPLGLQYDIGADLRFATRDTLQGYTRDYTFDTGIALQQPLLRNFWIDGGRANIQILKKELKMSEYQLANQVINTVHDVEQAYFNLVAAQDQVKVKQKAVELADRLLSENKKRVEVGTMAPLEEKQAESQAATSRAELIEALSVSGTAERVLKDLITDNYEEWFNMRLQPTERLMAIPEDFNLQASWTQGLTLRPDFNRAREEAERQGIEVRLRKNEVFPRLDLLGSYGRAGIDKTFGGSLADVRDDRLPRYSYGVEFSVPFTSRDSRYRLRGSRERLEQLEDRVKQLHQTILFEIENAIGVAKSAYALVGARRAASEYAEAALSAEEKKYENGRSTSFNVLQLQEDLTDARAQEVQALADYNKALSDLYWREGATLEKHRIEIK